MEFETYSFDNILQIIFVLYVQSNGHNVDAIANHVGAQLARQN